MDPDMTLVEIRNLCAEMRHPLATPQDVASIGDELAGLVTGLDQWLERGGFLPQAWSAAAR